MSRKTRYDYSGFRLSRIREPRFSHALLLLSWVFSLYLGRFGASSVYGSLATVAFALIWIYWCISLTLLGGCFNVWLGGKRGEKADPKEK